MCRRRRRRTAAGPRCRTARSGAGSAGAGGSPVGMCAASGGSPPSSSRPRSRPGDGTAATSACVYGMARALDHLLRAAVLDDPAQVHDRDAVAQRPRQPEVVGDEQQRQRARLAQVHQHLQHLRLHRHVEHRDRLVADQPVGVEHERGGDRHALALAARQLVRVAVGEPVGGQADVGQRPVDPRRVLGGRHLCDHQRLAHDRAHAHARVERLVRVLEDHLHALPQRPQLGAAVHRLAVDLDLAAGGAAPARASPARASTCRSRTRPRRRAPRRGATRTTRRRPRRAPRAR